MEDQETNTKVLNSLFIMVAVCVLTLLLRNTVALVVFPKGGEGAQLEILRSTQEDGRENVRLQPVG
ncbi:MAG: hypothetical protein K2Q26_05585 [Bdellovibrionales bacterium]|nr:hypothetical protein [Bdellovibrionales bacterium]